MLIYVPFVIPETPKEKFQISCALLYHDPLSESLFWILILIDPRIFLRLQPFPVQEAFKMDVLEVAQMYQMFQRLTRIQQRQPKPNS